MPFVLVEGDRVPSDFSLAPAPGYTPSAGDQQCLDRLNGYVTELAAMAADGTSRNDKQIEARNACVGQLRDLAERLVAGTMPATDAYLTTYVYQGRLAERMTRLGACVFWVSTVADNQYQTLLADINFELLQGQENTTKDQLDLKRALDKAATVVRVALSARRRPRQRLKQNTYIQGLAGIGQVGLTEGNLALATVTLETLQDDFVASEGARIKNSYVYRLGAWALLSVVLCTFTYLLVQPDSHFGPMVKLRELLFPEFARDTANPGILYRFRNFFLLAIGASLGAWLAFLFRRPRLGFADLVQMDDDLLNPATRIVFTMVLGLVVGLLFWTGMVSITVGNFSTQFENSGSTAMLIGAFCGIASRALATAVSRRAEDFAGNVGGGAAPVAGGQGP